MAGTEKVFEKFLPIYNYLSTLAVVIRTYDMYIYIYMVNICLPVSDDIPPRGKLKQKVLSRIWIRFYKILMGLVWVYSPYGNLFHSFLHVLLIFVFLFCCGENSYLPRCSVVFYLFFLFPYRLAFLLLYFIFIFFFFHFHFFSMNKIFFIFFNE